MPVLSVEVVVVPISRCAFSRSWENQGRLESGPSARNRPEQQIQIALAKWLQLRRSDEDPPDETTLFVLKLYGYPGCESIPSSKNNKN